jgi:hypothetical protein
MTMDRILTIPILCKQKKAHPLQDEKITKNKLKNLQKETLQSS